MIEWYWIIPISMLSGSFGMVMMAVIAGGSRGRGMNDPPTKLRPPAPNPQSIRSKNGLLKTQRPKR